MPVRADLDFLQPKSIPIARGPDYHFYENLPIGRWHKCHTLGFKNGLRVQKNPSQAIGGTKTVQDLQYYKPEQGEDVPYHGSLG